MAGRLRTVGRVAAVAALAMLMSACLKLDIDLTLSSEDTVSGSVIFAMDKGLIELTGQSFDDIMAESAPFPEDLEGVTIEDYEDEDFLGQRFVFDAVPISEFAGGGEDALSITREGDVFHVSGVLDLSTGLTGPTGLSGFDPEQLLQGAELQVRVTFPGEVTEANGQIEGNSVTWSPEVGERTEIQATGSAVESGGSSGFTMWLIFMGAALVVVVVAVMIVMQRRKSAAAPAGVEEAAAPTADTAAAPPAQAAAPPAEPMAAPGAPPPPASDQPAPPPPSSPAPPPPPPPGSEDAGPS